MIGSNLCFLRWLNHEHLLRFLPFGCLILLAGDSKFWVGSEIKVSDLLEAWKHDENKHKFLHKHKCIMIQGPIVIFIILNGLLGFLFYAKDFQFPHCPRLNDSGDNHPKRKQSGFFPLEGEFTLSYEYKFRA